MSDLALLDVDGPIATLTMNRPDKRNALSLDLLEALRAHVADLSERDDVAAVILRGAGRSFCAGMDLKAVLGEPGAPLKLLSSIAELTIALREAPQVVVAVAQGAAIGGGCGLVGVADLAITHPDAKLGYPEVDLGVCPAVVTPWLVDAVGAGTARRILLQGGTMTGQRAWELGLVSDLAPAAEMEDWVAAVSDRLAAAGRQALRATKRHIGELDGDRLHALVRRGAELSAAVIDGPEARERLGRLYGGA
jgi:enoyl-CoA hydratase/carnithine racemase